MLKVANIIEEGKIGGPQLRMLAVAKRLEKIISTTIYMPSDNSSAFQIECFGRKQCAYGQIRRSGNAF